MNSSCCITRTNIAARIRFCHISYLRYFSLPLVYSWLHLKGTLVYTPPWNKTAYKHLLHKSVPTRSLSNLMGSWFTPYVLPATGCCLITCKTTTVPHVTRLIADHRRLRTHSCSVSITASSIPKRDIEKHHTCLEEKSDDMCHIDHGSSVHIALFQGVSAHDT